MPGVRFSFDELKLIRDRIDIERNWGPDVYPQGDLDMFQQILNKCDAALALDKRPTQDKKED